MPTFEKISHYLNFTNPSSMRIVSGQSSIMCAEFHIYKLEVKASSLGREESFKNLLKMKRPGCEWTGHLHSQQLVTQLVPRETRCYLAESTLAVDSRSLALSLCVIS